VSREVGKRPDVGCRMSGKTEDPAFAGRQAETEDGRRKTGDRSTKPGEWRVEKGEVGAFLFERNRGCG